MVKRVGIGRRPSITPRVSLFIIKHLEIRNKIVFNVKAFHPGARRQL